MRKGNEGSVLTPCSKTPVNDDINKQAQPFDDALPERLLRREDAQGDTRSVRMHRGVPNVSSPYIVRLSHEKGSPVGESLIVEDADIFPDEAPLVEYHEGQLHFAEDYTLSQIVEDQASVTELPIIAEYPASRGYDLAVPEAPIFAEPKDIFAELLKEEFEKKEEEEAVVSPSHKLDEVLASLEETTPIGESQELEPESEPGSVSSSEPQEETYVVSYAGGEETVVQLTSRQDLIPLSLPKTSWKLHAKASLAFATLSAIVLLPLQASFVFADALTTKAEVEARGSAGLSQFLRGADALQEQDFSAASTLFGNASGAFAAASSSLDEVHGAVAAAITLIPSTEKTAATAEALLTIGESVSRASTLLARGMDEVSASQALGVTDRLAVMVAYTEEALPEMERASQAAKQVDPEMVPEDMREKVEQMLSLLPILSASFAEVITHADALGTLLGAEGKRTYMVVFQNNTELRPTGGFMGSFAEVSFESGAMTDMRIPGGGTYDVQGQLREFVAAPGPLQLLRARWEFQDANWFPDFPTSARKMLWFYQNAGGPSVDGVLAINASVLEEMLVVLGPIALKDGEEFNAENVLFKVQQEAEITHEDVSAPKAIIGELTQEIFTKLETADAQTLLRIASVFVDSLNDRDMQVYFSDNDLQKTMHNLGWTGEVRQTVDDYLMVVHTNVGGGKTDTVITRDIAVDTFIAEDGTIENTVTLTQTHNGMANALFTGLNNVDYVRLYVPEGSTFITGTGFEVPPNDLFQTEEYPLQVDEDLALAMQGVSKDPITETDMWDEQGKTVFGNWIQTAPGETQTVTFTYRLPWSALKGEDTGAWAFAKQMLGAREALSYGLVVQRQAGVAQNVLVRVHEPDGFTQVWSSEDKESQEIYVEDQGGDLFAGWIFER